MKNTKELKKRQTGITLIALVITIIVLLILAGVGIAMLTGNNGILTQVKLAKENTQAAKEQEEKSLDKVNRYINEKTMKDNYIDINGDKATVPAGFTVSGKKDEQIIANGLVIYDIPESEISNVDWDMASTKYNQFVWIPVTSKEAYQRDFTYPSYYDKVIGTTPVNSAFTDTGYLPTDIQPDVDDATNNEIAEKTAVLKYNGFYITRYEAGKDDLNVVSKQNAMVYTGKSQIDFKALGKTMYGESSIYVKSAMCSGIQWDMVMKFVDGKKDGNENTYDVRTYNSTRHTGNKTKTGKNLADKVQNIYDLEGNCFEYTAEKNNTSELFIYRGGSYVCNNIGFIVSRRVSFDGNPGNDITFRAVLYIK